MKKRKTKKKTLHQWAVPHENIFLFKAETILLATFVFLIFIFSFAIFKQRWSLAFLATFLFILAFLLVNFLLRKIYPLKETYTLTPSHLLIHRQAGKKHSQTKIPYRDIKKYKIDKLFHGARLETRNKRIPLYFNHPREIEKLEKILQKKTKRKKA